MRTTYRESVTGAITFYKTNRDACAKHSRIKSGRTIRLDCTKAIYLRGVFKKCRTDVL